jgi:hypothetical protein
MRLIRKKITDRIKKYSKKKKKMDYNIKLD